MPWVKTGNLSDALITASSADEWITDDAIQKSSAKILPKGTVLMAMYGDGKTIGSLGLLAEPVACNQACCAMLPDESKCLPEFLFFALMHYRSAIIQRAHGGAQRNLSGRLIKEFEIPVPPLDQQERIVAVLRLYWTLIENNTRRIEILEEMAGRAYEEWFVKFRHPGAAKDRLVDTEIGPLPETWEVEQLTDLCDLITDGAHRSPKSVREGLPMASVKDMHDWGLDLATCRQINKSEFDKLVEGNCQPLPGDVLIAKDGSYLKHTFVVERPVEVVLLSSIAILRPNGRLDPEIMALCLRHPNVVARMKGFVSGVAIPRIVLKDFKSFRVALPPPQLQREFLDVVQPMLALCRRLIDANRNLREQRELLLPPLVGGEISPGISIQAA